MFNKILVPIDGSECSLRALDAAKKIGEKFQSEIYILSVIQEINIVKQVPTAYTYSAQIQEGSMEMIKEILNNAVARISPYEYELHSEYLLGNVAKEIIKYAEDKDIGLIVIGSRGLGAFSRTLLGSVSNKVLNSSNKSVLVIK
ncbi:MAG: universal stress protein [Tissierellia bacterium]|nr:universal stress protein [Tissierellia bacterium]